MIYVLSVLTRKSRKHDSRLSVRPRWGGAQRRLRLEAPSEDSYLGAQTEIAGRARLLVSPELDKLDSQRKRPLSALNSNAPTGQ